ncbi:hypothetical protein IQ06DRAFT_296607 [Phaeosphaeriaceae sp. SRC1lsM3a]|nr:hypothetical protein IQ06DRAFT_296607 [Stagonospora sp. SRC1lsM3a]
MTVPDTDITSSAPVVKHETAKQWLQRRLRKVPSTRPTDQGIGESIPAQRPRTAPSSGFNAVPLVPSLPIDIHQPLRTHPYQMSPRPPRPDSGTRRNIDAWLDTSVTASSPPLMRGLPYWRRAIVENAKNAGMQHAMPIAQTLVIDRPSTAQSGLAKSFRRRAKRLEVRMPVVARDKPGGSRSRKQVNRRSNSVPVLSIPYDTAQREPPLVRPTVRLVPTIAPSHVNAETSGHDLSSEQSRFHDSLRTSGSCGLESSTEHHRHAFLRLSAQSVNSTRSLTAAARITRGDSVGDISDVPSYSSGLPPPSYRSRPASILTTSSFGCIDGMNPAQRQISQQRATAQRGVRGRLKRLAQSFTSST